MSDKPIIIYHSPCPDGFGAAYAAWRKFGYDAEYVPADHDAYPVLDVKGRDVFILDFSFPVSMMEAMHASARRVVTIDHHKTAQESLAGFPDVKFDLTKSGARLAWEYFHPGTPVPYLIQAIEDRDIWVWRLPDSREFLSHLDTLPFSFEVWDQIASQEKAELDEFIAAGALMVQKFESLADTLAADAEPVTLFGVEGHKVNCSYLFSNDVGVRLYSKSNSFAMVWWLEPGMLRVSLRAKKGGLDVSAFAKRFGGGGHPGSAAFRFKLGTPECVDFMNRYIFAAGQ
ncbi:NADH:ubiquinone oxidoreductase subunit L [Novimethylophilus kurashikiensis]|uniref:NADH:ubiquinone oxidoreductase subunit L n=1 Tax=Novimethylophilus kurashikiensis TaxID=1825523 RepID=A0A2R5F9H0_9PROT|nr:phosphoesterase [Novimethylophilus kurashikiensis]GBG14880.1 NADH:ubiquinone oxidoreductase subunit L [Novimethylophilus kurashikiensis]